MKDGPVPDSGRIFSPFDFSGRKAVVAGVSGGSDSLGMLLLLRRWLSEHAAGLTLVAVTVDHRLRPEARLEAEAVAQLCAAFGIEHRTVAWTGDKPATGLPAAARLARYRLLADAASSFGTDVLVTGHTADDQAETVAMRWERGSGRGLAGMAPATLFDGRCWIVRPLLRTRRADLRSWLTQIGVSWSDDPSNVDPAYERSRVRHGAPRSSVESLLETTRHEGIKRSSMGSQAAGVIGESFHMPAPGIVRFSEPFLRQQPTFGGGALVYSLRTVLAIVGGCEQLPEEARVSGLVGPGPARRTLSRSVIDRRKAGTYVYREARNIPECTGLRAGDVWDGRYRVLRDLGSQALGPIDKKAAADMLRDAPPQPDVPGGILRAGMAVCPWIKDGDKILSALPETEPVLAPWRLFMPSFDLALAAASARLFGAPAIPRPPLARHNGEEG